MRLLLDTQVVLALLDPKPSKLSQAIVRRLADLSDAGVVSVASIWEIAIKTRLGKLKPSLALEDIADYLEATGLSILAISASQAVALVDPEPQTRDPFDRLLLAQCQVEKLVLATVDRALLNHPLTVKI